MKAHHTYVTVIDGEVTDVHIKSYREDSKGMAGFFWFAKGEVFGELLKMKEDKQQEMIIDHGKQPRNFGVLPNANHRHAGHNPLCGDKLKLQINS